jgi:hypothetical protein
MGNAHYVRFKGRGKAPSKFIPEFISDVEKVIDKYKDILQVYEVSDECVNFGGLEEETAEELLFVAEERDAMCKTFDLPYAHPLKMVLILFCKHYPKRGEVSTEDNSGWEKASKEVEEMFTYDVSDILKKILEEN